MTKNKYRSLILLFVTLGTSITPLYATQAEQTQNHMADNGIISAEEKELMELQGMLRITIQLQNKVTSLISRIASVLNNNAIIRDEHRAKQSKEIMQQWNIELYKASEEIFDHMQRHNTIPVELMYTLLTQCETCMAHVGKTMRSNFDDLQDIAPTPIKTDKLVTLDGLTEKINTLETLLPEFEKQISFIGINWKNKVFRKIDSVLDWCGKRHLGKITLFGGGALALGVYKLWREKCPKSARYLIETNEDGTISATNYDGLGDPSNVWKQTITGKDLIELRKNDGWWFYGLFSRLGVVPRLASDGTEGFISDDHKTYFNTTISFITNHLRETDPIWAKGFSLLGGIAGVLAYQKAWPIIQQKAKHLWKKALGGIHKNEAEEIFFEFKPVYTFDDVIGHDTYKQNMQRLIEYCKDPEGQAAAKNIPKKGYIFSGETRTGKTFFAHAICGEIEKTIQENNSNLHFRYLTIPIDWAIRLKISGIMELARDFAPCIVFIDEIDLCGVKRGTEFFSDLITTLGQPEYTQNTKPIILLAATNKETQIDNAAKNGSRLGDPLRFEYPEVENRLEFIKRQLAKAAIPFDHLDLARIAQKLEGQSYDKIEEVITDARTKAFIRQNNFLDTHKNGHEPVRIGIAQEDIEESIDSTVRHLLWLERHKYVPKSEIKLLAAHFAGEALATILLQEDDQNARTVLDMVTIKSFMPRIVEEANDGTGNKSWQPSVVVGKTFTRNLGNTLNGDSYSATDRTRAIKNIKLLLAGFAAEEIMLNEPSSYLCNSNSVNQAFRLAKHIALRGIWRGNLSDALHNELDKEAFALFEQCRTEVKELLEQHKEQLQALSIALAHAETLRDGDVYFIMENAAMILKNIEEQSAAHVSTHHVAEDPDAVVA